ncbi:hypothetical protein [Streptomyces goshikiensis]|uniref:hypothetical protein n=1 Tax=Streptomyces goshikiensis TaxID=1942 RepID=UPI00369E29B6
MTAKPCSAALRFSVAQRAATSTGMDSQPFRILLYELRPSAVLRDRYLTWPEQTTRMQTL